MSPAEVCSVAICVATVMRGLLRDRRWDCPSFHAVPSSELAGDGPRDVDGIARSVGALGVDGDHDLALGEGEGPVATAVRREVAGLEADPDETLHEILL